MSYPHRFRLAPLFAAITAASGLSSAAYAQEKVNHPGFVGGRFI